MHLLEKSLLAATFECIENMNLLENSPVLIVNTPMMGASPTCLTTRCIGKVELETQSLCLASRTASRSCGVYSATSRSNLDPRGIETCMSSSANNTANPRDCGSNTTNTGPYGNRTTTKSCERATDTSLFGNVTYTSSFENTTKISKCEPCGKPTRKCTEKKPEVLITCNSSLEVGHQLQIDQSSMQHEKSDTSRITRCQHSNLAPRKTSISSPSALECHSNSDCRHSMQYKPARINSCQYTNPTSTLKCRSHSINLENNIQQKPSYIHLCQPSSPVLCRTCTVHEPSNVHLCQPTSSLLCRTDLSFGIRDMRHRWCKPAELVAYQCTNSSTQNCIDKINDHPFCKSSREACLSHNILVINERWKLTSLLYQSLYLLLHLLLLSLGCITALTLGLPKDVNVSVLSSSELVTVVRGLHRHLSMVDRGVHMMHPLCSSESVRCFRWPPWGYATHYGMYPAPFRKPRSSVQ